MMTLTAVKCKIQDLLKLQVKLGENGMDEEKELYEAKRPLISICGTVHGICRLTTIP